MIFKRVHITAPLMCPNIFCKYFGNASFKTCPVCGERLKQFTPLSVKLLNRVNNLEHVRSNESMRILIGRSKFLVEKGCEELIAIDPENVDELPI